MADQSILIAAVLPASLMPLFLLLLVRNAQGTPLTLSFSRNLSRAEGCEGQSQEAQRASIEKSVPKVASRLLVFYIGMVYLVYQTTNFAQSQELL